VKLEESCDANTVDSKLENTTSRQLNEWKHGKVEARKFRESTVKGHLPREQEHATNQPKWKGVF
jgi:hypothetical protein